MQSECVFRLCLYDVPSHRDDDNNDDNDREIVFTRYEPLSFAKDKFKFYAKRIRNCGRARFRLLFITCENASLAVRFRTCNSLSLFLSCSGLHCRFSSTTSYLSLSFRTRATWQYNARCVKSRVYNVTGVLISCIGNGSMGREGFSYTPIKPVTVCFRAHPLLKAKLYTTRGRARSSEVTRVTDTAETR